MLTKSLSIFTSRKLDWKDLRDINLESATDQVQGTAKGVREAPIPILRRGWTWESPCGLRFLIAHALQFATPAHSVETALLRARGYLQLTGTPSLAAFSCGKSPDHAKHDTLRRLMYEVVLRLVSGSSNCRTLP